MSKTKLAPFSVSPALQRLFVYSALIAFVVPSGYQIYMAASQYASNPNLSSYYWIALYGILAPVLFFVIAYWLSDKKKTLSARLFFSTFLAACGMMLLVAVETLVSQVLIGLTLAFSDAFFDWLWFEICTIAVLTLAYTALLVTLKRLGKL
jgi:hypothetical protein